MALNGFIEVQPSATLGGAPIDAFQLDAYRRNDLLFEKLLQGVLVSPFVPNGGDGASVTDPDPKAFVNARQIVVNNTITAESQVPLIWFAAERITINATINANGAGAPLNNPGDFGGSGGGGVGAGNTGQPCRMPFYQTAVLAVAAIGANGATPTDAVASRALQILPYCKGGSAGGGPNGGAGGGVVVLCAPIIEITAAGKIEAKGANGGNANSGGGGGGLVILIARRFINVNRNVNVLVTGGQKFAPANTSGIGGAGVILMREI